MCVRRRTIFLNILKGADSSVNSKNIDFSELYENLKDIIKECQTKIGYTDNELNFYYPVKSLNRFLDSDLTADELKEVLPEFSKYAEDTLGTLKFRLEGERFRFIIPREGSAYVHENVPDSPFLKEFIKETIRPGCDIDSVTAIFRKYSDKVICKKIENNEFEYLVYFEDGQPDSYRYCLEFEFGRAVYHRFTVKEYDSFGF